MNKVAPELLSLRDALMSFSLTSGVGEAVELAIAIDKLIAARILMHAGIVVEETIKRAAETQKEPQSTQGE